MSKIKEYIERAEHMVSSAKKLILGKSVAIDSEDMLDLLQKIRLAIPEEIKEANQVIALRDKRLRDASEQAELLVTDARKEEESIRVGIVEERQTILQEAQDTAQRLVYEAEHKRQQLLDESDITAQAQREADAIRASAEEYRKNILREVGIEIDAMLTVVEDFLANQMSAIREARIKAKDDFS